MAFRIYLSPPDLNGSELESLRQTLASNWVAPAGPQLVAFERAVCDRLGAPYGVALNSGTAAIHLALGLLGVGPGDTVVCPDFTLVGSVNPVRYLGAEPVLIDSEERTWNMDPELLAEALDTLEREGRPARAVVVVHLYGHCAEMETILTICRQRNVKVVEDAAEALGATVGTRHAGTMGDIGVLSFNGNKIVTTGGGGMLLTADGQWASRARFLATQARSGNWGYLHEEVGYNYRLSSLAAAVGIAQMQDLDSRIARRRAIFQTYREELGDIRGVGFMPLSTSGVCTCWLSCLRLRGREIPSGIGSQELCRQLALQGIEARPVWRPMHLQPLYAKTRRWGGEVAESLFSEGVCLPSSSSLTGEQQSEVIAQVRKLLLS